MAANATSNRESIGVSGNPAATNATTGTGWLGRQLGIKRDGVHLGGLWNAAGNYLVGGEKPGLSFNNQFFIDFHLDLEKTSGLRGTSFGAQFYQYNTQPSNDDAGSVLGYTGLVATPPNDRSELYQVWLRQEFFEGRFIMRVGKSNPSVDFANVIRPVLSVYRDREISNVTSLILGPVSPPATLYNVLPGGTDTAYGVTNTWIATENLYVSYGVYDGNQARGVATGLRLVPEFNDYYFHIAEAGLDWSLGSQKKPGSISAGGFRQTGKLSTDDGLVTEDGASGFYVVGSQQIWYRDAEPIDNAGISAYFQLGWNDTETLPFDVYAGAGLTFRGLVRSRPKDSFGAGMAWGRLNPNIFENTDEWIFQGYYQAFVAGQTYIQTSLSYMPDPGAEPGIPPAWALTQQIILPF